MRSTRTTLGMAILASLATGAHAYPAPPVQYRFVQSDPVVVPAYGPLKTLHFEISDYGDFVMFEAADGGVGLAQRTALDWAIIREPITPTEAAATGQWQPARLGGSLGPLVVASNGDLLFYATGGPSGDQTSMRRLARGSDGWSERELVILPPNILPFPNYLPLVTDNRGNVAWEVQTDPVVSGIVTIDHADGTQSTLDLAVIEPEIDRSFGDLGRLGINAILDDGGVMLSQYQFGNLAVHHLDPDGTITEIYFDSNTDASGDIFRAHPSGSYLIKALDYDTFEAEITWTTRGPTQTPPFTFNTADSEFLWSYVRVAFNRDAGLIMTADLRSPIGVTNTFILTGPDLQNDRLERVPEALTGQSRENFRIIDYNTRGEFMLNVFIPSAPNQDVIGTLCPADVNRDGVIDHGDITDWVTLFLDGSMRADFLNDGVIDSADVTEFITQFLHGC